MYNNKDLNLFAFFNFFLDMFFFFNIITQAPVKKLEVLNEKHESDYVG